jgi:hypothetical protein
MGIEMSFSVEVDNPNAPFHYVLEWDEFYRNFDLFRRHPNSINNIAYLQSMEKSEALAWTEKHGTLKDLKKLIIFVL